MLLRCLRHLNIEFLRELSCQKGMTAKKTEPLRLPWNIQWNNSKNLGTYGCFLKWWVFPISHPKMIMFSRKTHGLLGKPTILRKHPYGYCLVVLGLSGQVKVKLGSDPPIFRPALEPNDRYQNWDFGEEKNGVFSQKVPCFPCGNIFWSKISQNKVCV